MAKSERTQKRKAAPDSQKPTKRVRISAKASTTNEEPAHTPSIAEEKPLPEPEKSLSKDDELAELLKGFESTDESDDEDGAVPLPSESTISSLPTLPVSTEVQNKIAAASKQTDEPGVVYVGRIPHGFYEHQMKAYFSQFGDITRLRLSRNRRTGASKHYAFIEFASSEVADIVAETMNGYLMFGHLLKVQVIPKDNMREDLFKKSNRRFKKIPWNRIERFKLEKSDREGWDKRVSKEETRRKRKMARMKSLGYEFDSPALKKPSEVPVKKIEATSEVKAIEAQ